MTNVNDCKMTALETLTSLTGNVNDLEKVYLESLGATTGQINAQWMEIFIANGATSANWSDAANEFLIALGAPGVNVADNWEWFWCVNEGVISSLVFHALADVEGSFVNDVILGTGNIAEGNTSTRYYADDTATPIWQPFTTGEQAITFAGTKWWEVGQMAITNDQIRSNDLTNVEWTATNMTVTKDQTGMRNDANGACRLLATAANATVVANAITDASDDQTTRWFITRDTGTGGVELSVDGEVSWVDVTTEVDSTAGFNECLADQAALANPQIAIRLVVDTDAVIVGNAEAVLGDLKEAVRQSSPVFTVAAPVSIAGSDLSVPDTNHDDTQGLWTCEVRNAGMNATNRSGLIGLGGAGRLLIVANGGAAFRADDGPNLTDGPAITLAADDTEYFVALAYGSGSMRIRTDSAWGTASTYDGEFDNTVGKIAINSSTSFGAPPISTMLIRDIRRYALSYTAAQAKAEELSP